MDPVTLLGAAGLVGVGWWLRRAQRSQRDAGPGLADDADVALHVAVHELRTRHHPWMGPLHLLYGLLQDEAFTAALRGSGADPDALEDRVLAGLDSAPTEAAGRELERAVRYAIVIGHLNQRPVRCVDLWAGLTAGGAILGALLDAATVDRHAVLYRLCHGDAPSLTEQATGSWDVVFHNDDYTTKELVCELLEQVFALPATEAVTVMETVHTQGRASIARLPAATAQAKVDEARRRARDRGAPLRIDLEPW